MRLIDADALEKDGWCMTRNVQINKTTMEFQTRKPTDFPTIDPEQRWIPVTDGEPFEDQECWFSVNDGGFLYVHHGSFTRRYGERHDMGFITSGGFAWWNTVTAWMPIFIPEPFEGGER